MPPPNSKGFVPIGNVRIYYATYGSGPPLLLIHNGVGDADDWAPVIPLLAGRYEILVADTRGFGRSTRDSTPYSYDLLASDYLHLIDALHLRRVVVVGSSDGAIIGLDLAIHHPSRIAGLFAQGVNASPDAFKDPSDLTAIRLALAHGKAEYERLSPTPTDYRAFRQALAKMDADQPNFSREQLASVRSPTAIVVSDHEESITPAHSKYLASTIPHASLITLHSVSHFAPLQDPSQFATSVLAFVATVPGWKAAPRPRLRPDPGQPR
jgi:pimeloyl-ACP methyl ester carboxylesterase